MKDTETCVGSSLVSYFVLFSLISLVSFYFVFISLISFRFYFVSHFIGTPHLLCYGAQQLEENFFSTFVDILFSVF